MLRSPGCLRWLTRYQSMAIATPPLNIVMRLFIVFPPLLPVQFSCLLCKRGNIFAGKECAPGFDIVFVARKKEVPQLHGLFRSQMLKHY
jgi:hypothetical protein